MNELVFIANISFNEKAIQFFNFPIYNEIRTSFWFPDSESTTFCEISFEDSLTSINQLVKAKLMIGNKDIIFSKDSKKFNIGTFPIIIGGGYILDILNKNYI